MALAIIFVTFLLRIQFSMAAPDQEYLGSTGRFQDQPLDLNFKNNIQNLLNTLALQASKTGFYKSSFGEAPYQVYGLYLCRGDLDSQSCSDCVSYAKDHIPAGWENFIEAEYRYANCMLRYSNMTIVAKMDEISWGGSFSKPRNGTLNQIWFKQVLNVTLSQLAIEAANDASGVKFATKVAKISRSETLYAMGQCTWDLTASDCNKCLTKMADELLLMKCSPSWSNARAHSPKYCSWSSARAHSPNCMIRYETFPFFNSTVKLPQSSFPALPMKEVQVM